MFDVLGPNVRITGLRIAGHDQARHMNDSSSQPNACGIRVNFSIFEVDNCELYGWTHSSLCIAGVLDPSDPINDNIILDNINIHHNYIHHNQMNGLGYGMQLYRCKALVEGNIFDYNRHSIEGSGEPGTWYEARYNLQLNNILDHAFDMHSYPVPIFPNGVSGEKIMIHHNSFWAWHNQSIGIGAPNDSAYIFLNFFAETDQDTAINSQAYYSPIPTNMLIIGNKFGI